MLYLSIPKQIKVEIGDFWILIKGPLGEKKKRKMKSIEMIFDENTSKLWLLSSNLKENHFYLIILKKIILGVWKGFSKKLNISKYKTVEIIITLARQRTNAEHKPKNLA